MDNIKNNITSSFFIRQCLFCLEKKLRKSCWNLCRFKNLSFGKHAFNVFVNFLTHKILATLLFSTKIIFWGCQTRIWYKICNILKGKMVKIIFLLNMLIYTFSVLLAHKRVFPLPHDISFQFVLLRLKLHAPFATLGQFCIQVAKFIYNDAIIHASQTNRIIHCSE